uniref:Uncharacterized protein n=1 Tax=Rhodococcus hoagii TaxID=43767 RepID=A0A1Z1UYP2_RHOHA|nr:hypothetical protein pVAPN1354_0742 [Prescottella equi]ARX59971.1 hypothetical protein pVAPN1557_0742 [Prescottella equi]
MRAVQFLRKNYTYAEGEGGGIPSFGEPIGFMEKLFFSA